MKIVFMGTPDFAVPSLRILVENGYDVVGVVTATDKFGGRGGKKLLQSAVKKFALAHKIPVLQPTKFKNPEFLDSLRALQADLQVVVAFRMLPEVVWAMPTKGTFNLHGSLLPKYRGAAPINWAVINGETQTGVTSFMIQHEIDTGDMILQKTMPIHPMDTAGDVHNHMMELGAKVVLETVQLIEQGDLQFQKQDHTLATKAPKIFHETCAINFDQPTSRVHDFIRGLSPYPAAWTMLEDKQLKILKTEPMIENHSYAPGSYLADTKALRITTKDGYLNILELQLQGRKRMPIKDFLNGHGQVFQKFVVS